MSNHAQKQAYKQAEHIGHQLVEGIEKTITMWEKQDPGSLKNHIETYLKPALAALAAPGISPVRRLSDACDFLDIIRGSGWSGISYTSELSDAYSKANSFYQECWGNGIS